MPSTLSRRCQLSADGSATRWLVLGIALVLLLAALVTPWGLTQSHGIAAVSAVDHDHSHAHGHEHEDGHSHQGDGVTPTVAHVHHAGDHSHDHAHALPMGLPGLSEATAVWRVRLAHAGPWPSLDGLERPPRA